MQKAKYILVSFSSIMFTILVGLLVINKINEKFLEISLAQILQLVVALAIGIFVSYYLNHKNSKETKKKEIILKIIDELKIWIIQSKDKLPVCFDDLSVDDNKKQIQIILRGIENKVDIMKKINISASINRLTSECYDCSNKAKEIITGNGWGIIEVIPPSERLEIERNIQSICTRLDTLQIELLNM